MDRVVKETIDNLLKHNFDAKYFKDLEEVKEEIMYYMKNANSFAFGGSKTYEETGIKNFIIKNCGNKQYIERSSENEEKKIISERNALLSDLYFTGVNAISKSGELVNIDKRGNRVSAVIFGPRKVVLLAGVNKIADDLEKALFRAKNKAAPLNAKRFNLKTPCVELEKCVDCEHDDGICFTTIIMRKCFPKKRISVFLVDKEYGF